MPTLTPARSRATRLVRRGVIAVAIAVALLGLAVLGSNLLITRSAAPHVVTDPALAPRAQCAIILGAKVYPSGTPAPMLADRLETGIRLYKLGKVDKLLLSGDHGQTDYDEVNVMLDYVLARGVPPEDVFTDHAGFDTYDTMYRARDVFKVKTALVVTQGFHLRRAVYIARRLGLEAVGVAADLQPYADETKNRMREWLARVKAVVELHLTHPEPKYLGSPIPIEGDGRASRG